MTKNIFFDLDGCLITPSYQFNIPLEEVQSAIRSLQGDGTKIHVNSNRSIASIESIRATLGFNGCVIYENGAGIYNPITKIKDGNGTRLFDKKMLTKVLNNAGFPTYFIDTDQEFPRNIERTVVFCEKTREYSVTAYPRKEEEVSGINRIYSVLYDSFGATYDINKNQVYQNIILTLKKINKGCALKYFDGISASFGDEVADISMFNKSDICGCPSNASEEVKKYVQKRGGFLACNPYTLGAREFMNYLEEQL